MIAYIVVNESYGEQVVCTYPQLVNSIRELGWDVQLIVQYDSARDCQVITDDRGRLVAVEAGYEKIG